jgi:hypothetical protein
MERAFTSFTPKNMIIAKQRSTTEGEPIDSVDSSRSNLFARFDEKQRSTTKRESIPYTYKK